MQARDTMVTQSDVIRRVLQVFPGAKVVSTDPRWTKEDKGREKQKQLALF